VRQKVLDWKPMPGRLNNADCYAERAGSRWMVKYAGTGRNRCAVLRLNGAELQRFETMRGAKAHAEHMALDREVVR
jgi:hypothetical protein